MTVDVQKSTNEQCGQCYDRRLFGGGYCCFNRNSENFMKYVNTCDSCNKCNNKIK